MVRIIKIIKSQSMLEYAILISVVSAALLAMNVYVQRSLNARLKVVEEELNDSIR
jgi:Flp pilus assembly pilin Flp